MFRFNHLYYLIVLLLFTTVQGRSVFVEKINDGLYRINSEKSFHIEEQLTLYISNFDGEVAITGNDSRNVAIREIATIKTYSEKAAKNEYHQSKAGFILNKTLLKIDGNRKRGNHISRLELDVPVATRISIENNHSDIMITNTDGDLSLNCNECDIALNNVSSKLSLSVKNSDVVIQDSRLFGDVQLSRGSLTITELNSEYFNAELFGGDFDAEHLNTKAIVKTTGGDITIQHSLGDAKLYTSGGSIMVNQIDGNLACDVKGGDITIGAVGGLCKLTSKRGDISVEKADSKINIDAFWADVHLKEARESVSIDNRKGDITLTKTQGNGRVLVKNIAGDITLYLDSDMSVAITAKINFQKGNDWQIQSDFDLTDTKMKQKRGKGYLIKSGEFNEGVEPIILNNTDGDIYIYEN